MSREGFTLPFSSRFTWWSLVLSSLIVKINFAKNVVTVVNSGHCSHQWSL